MDYGIYVICGFMGITMVIASIYFKKAMKE
jgi:hypothetical protein